MGLFGEQIKQRRESDQNILEDSFFRMAGVVMDSWVRDHPDGERLMTGEALGDILRYYHQKKQEIPDNILKTDKELLYTLRTTGLMVREVELEDGWQRNASGAMLCSLKDSGVTVALLPGTFGGYRYRDPETGKWVRVTRGAAQQLSRDALCFYRPLPMKKLGIPDLLGYMRSTIERGDLALVVLVSLAATLLGMIEPRIYNLITGPVLHGRNLYLLFGVGSFLLCSAFAAQIIGMMRTLLLERIGEKTFQAVESSVMMRILMLPVSFFRDFSAGELYSRAESINSLCDILLDSILSIGVSSLMSLLYVAQIFRYAPALVWPSVLIIFAMLAISVAAAVLQAGISSREMNLGAKERGMSFGIIRGIRKIRLAGAEKRAFARWGRLYALRARLQYDPPMFLKVHAVMATAVSLLGTVVLYYLAVKTGVSPSQYYAFNAAYGRLSASFTALTGVAVLMAGIRPVLEMAEPILKTEPEVMAEKKTVDSLGGNIEMSHVSFRYSENSPYILKDLSLKIRAGEYVAIVGRTGCGKSTLVRLLLGFDKPELGSINYDIHDLNQIDPRSIRRQIGVVLQNGQLFLGDIYSNIVISAPELSLEDAWEAAEIAGIAQDIRDMPMGMSTMISENSGGISGGQKQRLLIARAVAPKPKILIFDEATSALDNKTQKQVSDALDKMGCTRIVIAHRLSTIRHCDRILVLEGGRIIEEGKYEELIEKGGFFSELVKRQRMDKE